jgi:hypothetical protein
MGKDVAVNGGGMASDVTKHVAHDVVYGSVNEARDMDGLGRLIAFAFGVEPKPALEWL